LTIKKAKIIIKSPLTEDELSVTKEIKRIFYLIKVDGVKIYVYV